MERIKLRGLKARRRAEMGVKSDGNSGDRMARVMARRLTGGGVRDGYSGRCYEGGRWAGHKAANRRGHIVTVRGERLAVRGKTTGITCRATDIERLHSTDSN